MMQSILTTYVLLTFIAGGISLDCEECVGHGAICHGPKKTCSAGEDKCALIVTETMGIQNTMNSMKRCMESRACIPDQIRFNTGQRLIAATTIFCCVGEDCENPPALLPRNLTLNGKKCPACFSMQAECKEEIIPCIGDENYCFQMSGSSTVEGIAGEIHVKGCANKAACDSKDIIVGISFPGIILKQSAVCTGGSASIHPESFAISLTILTGLLLLKSLM